MNGARGAEGKEGESSYFCKESRRDGARDRISHEQGLREEGEALSENKFLTALCAKKEERPSFVLVCALLCLVVAAVMPALWPSPAKTPTLRESKIKKEGGSHGE